MEMVHSYEERIARGERPTADEYAAQSFGYVETVDYIQKSAEHLRTVCKDAGLPLDEVSAPVMS